MSKRCMIIGLFVCIVAPLIGDDYVDDIYFQPEKVMHKQPEQFKPQYNPKHVKELDMQIPTDTAILESDTLIVYHPI